MSALAPFPIIFGILAIVLGLFWLVAAGSDENEGPDTGMFIVFGFYYMAARVMRQLFNDPVSVLPGFGFIVAGAGLIMLGFWML